MSGIPTDLSKTFQQKADIAAAGGVNYPVGKKNTFRRISSAGVVGGSSTNVMLDFWETYKAGRNAPKCRDCLLYQEWQTKIIKD